MGENEKIGRKSQQKFLFEIIKYDQLTMNVNYYLYLTIGNI